MTEDLHSRLNFQQKLNKIRDICGMWLHRSLSLKGKIVLINSLLISTLQYPCSCTFTPACVITEFKKICTDFIWNARRSKIAYSLLIRDIAEGGLKLPDLETRLNVAHLYWIKHIWSNPISPLSLSAQGILGLTDHISLIISKKNFATFFHDRQIFLRQIFTTWAACHIFPPETEVDIQKELLWHNSYILIGLVPVCWRNWVDAGIRYINNLPHPAEPRFLSHEEVHHKYGITVSFLQCYRSDLRFHTTGESSFSAQQPKTYKLFPSCQHQTVHFSRYPT